MKFPKKSQFSKLSDCVVTKHFQGWDVATIEVDDLCAAERYDFTSDLNSILLGKLPRFLLKRNEHLKVLSMETILESQFVDDIVVKRILSEANKEWVKTKPLQLIGTHVPGKPFIDKPPKRVLRTDTSLEQCQQLFKDGVCRYLADFCHLLDSDELLNFFMDDILDNVVRKRFEHFRSQLAKNVEKWCDELKQLEFPRLGTLKSLSKNPSQISSNNFKNKSSYALNIEQELDEIIKSQFAELHQPAKKRKICTQESLNLDDVLSAQMLDDNGDKNKSSKNKNSLQINLEKEFDVFTEELANICNRDNQKIVDNLYSPIHHMDDGTDELFDDGIACSAKSNAGPPKGSLSGNESGEALSTTIQKSKAVSRSLRKKKLDKEDQQENAQKRHKRKKEDKKHKLKKRKKNKHKDADKDIPSKSEERELNAQIQNDLKCDEQPVKKSFRPEPRLYEDSYLSSGFDVYQSQKGIDRLYTNFDVDFDPTLAPGSQESPLMHIFMDSSGVMEQLVGVIPDIKQFCVDLVSSKNAFLWALSLSTLDPMQNRQDDDETPRKQALKCSNNPLMQAFRQAVEASKKKDEVKVKSCKKSKNSAQTKSLFKSFGLMGIFKMNANLKATSRELIKDAFNTFQNGVDNYSKEENFFENHMTHEIDFSGVSPHLEKVSQVMSDLYHGAEKKLSSRGKSKTMRYNPLKSVVGMHSYMSNNLKGTASQLNCADRTNVSNAATASFSAQSSAYTSGAVYSASAASITASTLGYSGYAYNPYSAMHYPQVTWAYQAGYIPGYMPDLSSMQAYQGLAMQYPMMASASVVPANAEVMQTLQQPVAATSDENSTDWNVASQTLAADEASLGKSSAKKASALNRPPKNTRTYIFKNETALSKEVERYLDNIGLKKFDLYNLALLRHLPNFECLIFIHEEDSKLVNQIPGLLRLKRDLRVVFVVYNNFDDVMNKKYSMIFPRAGMVLMDESALIACKSGS